jgi:hypothetical protein
MTDTSLELNYDSTKDPLVLSFYKEVELNKKSIESTTDNFSIFFPYITNVYSVYFNGEKIASGGQMENGHVRKNGRRKNLIVVIPKRLVLEGKNEIYIMLQGEKFDHIALYGKSKMNIDLHENHREQASERFLLMLIFLYTFVGIYHFYLYYLRPQDRYTLYFAAFCSFSGLYIFTTGTTVYELRLDSYLIWRLEMILIFFMSSMFIFFFESLYKGEISKNSKKYFYFTTLLIILIPLSPMHWCYRFLLLWQISALVYIAPYLTYLNFSYFLKKNEDAYYIGIASVIFLITAFLHILGQVDILPREFDGIGFYGFFIFINGIIMALANHFTRMREQIEAMKAQ